MPRADMAALVQNMERLRDPLEPMPGTSRPRSARAVRWWKIALASVNEGLRTGIFNLSTIGPAQPLTHEWTLRGIPARTRYRSAGWGEVEFVTRLWPVQDLPDRQPKGWDKRGVVTATGWLERRNGKWLMDSATLLKGATRQRADHLDGLKFEAPAGYKALGRLII